MTAQHGFEHFTVEDGATGMRHAALVGPGVLCRRDQQLVDVASWEHGTGTVDCPLCLEVLQLQQTPRMPPKRWMTSRQRAARLIIEALWLEPETWGACWNEIWDELYATAAGAA